MKKLNKNLLPIFIMIGMLFAGKLANATVCGTDTVLFTMQKASGYGAIAINNATSATALAQYYTAPQAITIYGFDFYGNAEGVASMSINAYVYRAGADSLPTGSPLASATIVVDSSTTDNYNGVTFSSPLTVTFPYVLVVSNPSPTNFAIFSNDWTVADGAGDNLSSALLGPTWFHAKDLLVGGVPYDADAIFNPHVSYTILANDTIVPVPYCAGGLATVTDKSSPILHDPMYSVAAFFNVDSIQFTYGITSFPTITDDNFSIVIPPAGTYSVTQTDTMIAWTNICVASVTKSFTVINAPVAPTSISGPTSVCAGSGVTYSVAPVAYATSYVWTLPSGWTGTSTTNSIIVTAGATSGSITVYARNGCGNSATTVLPVTSSGAITIPGTISGPLTPCAGTSVTYSIAPVAGASSYTWTLPSGWTGTSTSTSITCTAGASSGNVQVSAVSVACGSSAPSSLAVTPRDVPNISSANLFMPSPLCQGSNYLLTILGVSNAVSYTWSIPGDWSGSSSNDSLFATVGATSGNISIVATNACGNSSPYVVAATVSTPPATPGSIIGDLTPCEGGSAWFSVSPVAGASSYTWTVPAGWTGSSATNSIYVLNDKTAGSISVVANNGCGSSAASTQALVPGASSITASTSVSPASSGTAADGAITVGVVSGGVAPYSYSIDSITFQTSPFFAGLVAGSYNITVKDSNGCTSTLASVVVFTSGIETLKNYSSFDLYPNPASKTFNLRINFDHSIQNVHLRISDLLGREVQDALFTKQTKLNESIDVSALAPGHYLIRVDADDCVIQDKLIIVR